MLFRPVGAQRLCLSTNAVVLLDNHLFAVLDDQALVAVSHTLAGEVVGAAVGRCGGQDSLNAAGLWLGRNVIDKRHLQVVKIACGRVAGAKHRELELAASGDVKEEV